MASDWQKTVAEKQLRQAATIPDEWKLIHDVPLDVLNVTQIPLTCGMLSEEEIQITESTVEVLLPKIASGHWSAVVVTTAFYKRAIIAHQLTNCLTEIFVDKAIARAKELDEHLRVTGNVVGPLHGLPISLKDQLIVKGVESTMGYVSWIGNHGTRNSDLVDILLDLGAVPMVKTNVPQTLMWPETYNVIFGRTVNPHNRSLTTGGSSGGEGALVAMKGSPLGVGSDIGGSIRIPSGLCGVYGFRPSYGRIPASNIVNSLEGGDSVLPVFGPISNSVEGLKVFMQSVVSRKPWLKDPMALRKPWSDAEYELEEHGGGKRLCFAVMWDDKVVRPHPPVIRGLEVAKQALLAAGHQVIDWEPINHGAMYQCLLEIWGAAATEDFTAVASLSGEPLLTSMEPGKEFELGKIAEFKYGSETNSAYGLWQVQKRKRTYRDEYLAHWEATISRTDTGRPVDAILAPVAAYTATPHGMNKSAAYTMLYNLLDYTTAVVPVTKVDPELDTKKPPHAFYGEHDEMNYQMYDGPATFADAPVSIQIVGRSQEEEGVLAMTRIVDNALKDANKSRM